jgi:hypothetical protein
MSTSIPPILPKNQPPLLSDNQPPLPPKRDPEEFTLTGCLMVMLASIATLAFGLFLPFWFFPRFLPLNAYPSVLILFPTVGFGIAFMVSFSWIAKMLGFPVTIPKKKNPNDERLIDENTSSAP